MVRKPALFLIALAAYAQAPTQQAVGTMSQLMVDIIYPTSDAIFYIEANAPKNDADWERVRTNALALAESANLLMMPARARDTEKWMADAKLLLDAGQTAYRASREKNLQALIDLNQTLVDACTTCHFDYRPNYGRRRGNANKQKQ